MRRALPMGSAGGQPGQPGQPQMPGQPGPRPDQSQEPGPQGGMYL
jgi:hypothetical protein